MNKIKYEPEPNVTKITELDEEDCDPEDGIVGLGEGMLTEGELGD